MSEEAAVGASGYQTADAAVSRGVQAGANQTVRFFSDFSDLRGLSNLAFLMLFRAPHKYLFSYVVEVQTLPSFCSPSGLGAFGSAEPLSHLTGPRGPVNGPHKPHLLGCPSSSRCPSGLCHPVKPRTATLSWGGRGWPQRPHGAARRS